MKKVISFVLGLGALILFCKSAALSFLYLYKTGGFILAFLALFCWPFTIVAVPFLAGFQQSNWSPMLNGLGAIFVLLLFGVSKAFTGDD